MFRKKNIDRNLKVVVGNIVDDEFLKDADIIINPTNPKMRYGMGVCGAIFDKAGIDQLEKYCEKEFGVGYGNGQEVNDMKPTEIRVTPGFSIPCAIMFAQGPSTSYFDINESDMLPLLDKTYKNIFKKCLELKFKRILLPSLGTGHYGIDHKKASKILLENAKDFLQKMPDAIITVVLFDHNFIDYYRNWNKSEIIPVP